MRWAGVGAVPEAGVVALEPLRLAALQGYLGTLADGCFRGQREVASSLVGTDEAAPTQEAELRRVGEWCRVQADGIARRRRILEALPSVLPLPDVVFRSRCAAEASAAELAERISEALGGDPPRWSVLSGLLGQVDRRTHSPAFLGTLRRRLGPDALMRLPFLVEVGHGAHARDAGRAAADLAKVRGTVGDLVTGADLGATGEPVPEKPPMVWQLAAAVGLGVDAEERETLAQAADDAGWGFDIARGLRGLAARSDGAAAAGRWATPLALAGLVADVAKVVDDPDAKDVLSLVSDGLLAAAPFAGGAAPVLFAGGIVAAIAGFALGRPWDLDDDDRDVRRYNPGTGSSAYPSGSRTNPNADVAGGPLPPGHA